ncbi:Rieske 2Fe-2S domain-containing protein [Caulobacter sp. ErkDOM-YI]|uniref:Rieske 2Fe-2S domain-containing protein n=1 Tax=unclassified Caulobacter TaxID=2648921 RepID=UPI003AF695C7
MAHDYKPVQWTPYKKAFDAVLAFGVAAFIAAFVASAITAFPGERPLLIQILIRAFGAAALALLTFILMIGPLARLSTRFLPILYNRRHLGVVCFGLALTHAALVVVWYHGFSDINPLVSLLTSNPRYVALQGFPFESLGLIALLVLFVMAATSHDFWNTNLGPVLWKAIHMSVYWAYALVVAHVMLGAVQGQKGMAYALIVGAGAVLVTLLHGLAGRREVRFDLEAAKPDPEGWLRVGLPHDIEDGRAKIVAVADGERIAVFRDGENLYAVSNLCAHQGGPLGEGRVLDGCVTCPWHGFQFRLTDGRAPAPYTDRVATYATRVLDGVVYVRTTPEAAA